MSHLKILGARTIPQRKFHTEHQQTSGDGHKIQYPWRPGARIFSTPAHYEINFR